MTEAEWLTTANPRPLLAFLRGKASDRKLRLFCACCCRRIWHILTDERSRHAVEIAERIPDSLADETERESAETQARQAVHEAVLARQESEYDLPEMFLLAAKAASYSCFGDEGLETASAVVAVCSLIARNPASSLGWESENGLYSTLLRDIFGNPFRSVAVEPSWLTSDVVALVEGIYADRAFDRMPIVADALQEAGCEDENILNHCRGPGPHVRGCWVIDLLLGKA